MTKHSMDDVKKAPIFSCFYIFKNLKINTSASFHTFNLYYLEDFPLFINVLANISIICLSIYFYFRLQYIFNSHQWHDWQIAFDYLLLFFEKIPKT